MARFPRTRWRDLPGLAALLLMARIRRGDQSEAVSEWLRVLSRRYGSPDLFVDLVGRRVLFVSGARLSRHVLEASPSREDFVAGNIKRKAMSFLAPCALTILHGESWGVFRAYNEEVLQPRKPHAHLPFILPQVERAFGGPVEDIDDIRRRMGQVMLATVFGEAQAPDHLIADIQELFAEVGIRTGLIGSRKTAKREQFRSELRRLWKSEAGGGPPTLLTLAHRAASRLAPKYQREEFLLDQIPHWMFTFTNSGSDLLARSLALITARPACFARVLQEIDASGPLNSHSNPGNLPYLEACIWETGRLFPPVGQTAHHARRTHAFDGMEIEAGTEIVQYFPFINRDVSQDPLANHFRPERWLDPDDPIHSREFNIFLSGPRACPGKDIMLLVVKSAIAALMRNRHVQPQRSLLSDDPLPFSFVSGYFPGRVQAANA